MKKKYGMITKASVRPFIIFTCAGEKEKQHSVWWIDVQNTKNIFLITRTRIFYTSLVSHKYK